MSVNDEDAVTSRFHWRGRWGRRGECQRRHEGDTSPSWEWAAADLAKGRTPLVGYSLKGW